MSKINKLKFSVIIPCYNEEMAIRETVETINKCIEDRNDYEIIVVNDGSTDKSGEILESITPNYPALKVIEHQKNKGYGAALKTGILAAGSDLIVITDADGTYPNHRISEFVDKCEDHDMVVGARTAENVTYSKIRAFPKFFLKHWVSWLARRDVPDINSGFRVFRKDVARQYFRILSDQFSFTISITLAMLTNYRSVLFVPIDYHERVGNSKIKPIRDTARFILLILRTGTYFAPARSFAPFFIGMFALALSSLGYDVFVLNDLTEKTVLLFLFSFNTALFALLGDMIDKRS